jgi:Polyprenyl synthetase
MKLAEYLAAQQQLIDAELSRIVPAESVAPETIHRAMRYSLMAGGKRIRPILCLEAARTLSDVIDGVMAAACSLEFIHTYSLIHDDLPALDNDDFRRGKPTCHKVFGDAMAILAGDALLTIAFQVLSELPHASPDVRVAMIRELSTASGTVDGMIGGQVADIEGERQAPTADPSRKDRSAAARQCANGSDLRRRYGGAGSEAFGIRRACGTGVPDCRRYSGRRGKLGSIRQDRGQRCPAGEDHLSCCVWARPIQGDGGARMRESACRSCFVWRACRPSASDRGPDCSSQILKRS